MTSEPALPTFPQPTTADARNLPAARHYGARVAAAVPVGTEGLTLGSAAEAAIIAAAAAAGIAATAGARRGSEAAVEVSYQLRKRQAAAHTAGTWCPTGGCFYCTTTDGRAILAQGG